MSSEDVQLLDSKKTLGGLDIFLGMITVMFFLDTIGPVAAMGTASITWMLIIAVLFFVPYGLITAELGSTYPDEGGMYAWVKRAFGKRWGVRVTWMYWVNNAVWISSATIFIVGVACQLFMPDTSFSVQLVLTVALIWLVVLVGMRPLKESKWLTNVSGVIKLLIAAGIIISAIIYISRGNAAANDFSMASFIPKLGDSFIFFPALIYNFLGFEVMSAMGGQMKNPKKDVPRAVISNAFLITALYILVTTSILMIIPADEVNIVESIMDCFMVSLGGGAASAIVVVFGLMFLCILFGQIVTWITAACNMAAEASADGELPKVFAIRHKKNGTPMGTLIITGVIGTFLTVLYGLMVGSAEDLFWMLFSFTSIIFLMPFLIAFQAYIKMKKTDLSTPRPYCFPGGYGVSIFFAHLSQFVIGFTIVVFFWVPGSPIDWGYDTPLFLGVVIALAVGEYLANKSIRQSEQAEYEEEKKRA